MNIRGSIRETKTFCSTGIYSSVTSSLFYEILNSVRKGDWDLFIDAVLRSLPLFFATGRSNYSRWGSLFYQDCLDLQRKFPDLYSHFTKGLFVCHLTKRGGSGIGFDMGLEVTYNFTAKAGGGIIGVTREKTAVALWDIIKHEKDRFVAFIKEMVNIGEGSDELNLHHDYNANAASKSLERVQQLTDYIKTIGNPFLFGNKLINTVTHEELTHEPEYLLNCVPFGEKLYEDFVRDRLDLKTISLFATISSKYAPMDPNNQRV